MEIECKFSPSPIGYSCEVSKVAITKPNVDIASFEGNHQPGKSNDDVTRVIFENAEAKYFPRNLQKIFPNLKTLQIINCGLEEISREDLIGLENLVSLNLRSNPLTSLPDDLFSNMPNLKKVFLISNKIEFASSKLIDPIAGNQLEHFYLKKNTSIDEYYSQCASGGCKTIQELMAKIDEKCKPPKTQPILKTAQPESICESAEEIFKEFNEHRLLGSYTKAVEVFLKLPVPLNAMEIFKLAAKYEVVKLKIICEKIIHENLDESNAFEIFKLASGPHKSEKLKVAAFGKLEENFGGELDADLINDPEKLQKIVEAQEVLDDLLQESSAKNQRLV